MIPVLTPEEMAAVDAAAPQPVEVLIARAGAAVGRTALRMLGGTYGRRVTIVHGKGNNGADGQMAGAYLRRRGVRVHFIDAATTTTESSVPGQPTVPLTDLIVDAAYGTGFRGTFDASDLASGQAVLAVDIPSGIDGLTGDRHGRPWLADTTVTFAALKPGLLFADGPTYAGNISVADIGLDVGQATCHLVEAADVLRCWPTRDRQAHKWRSALAVIGGSPGLEGAASLTSEVGLRSGAGYVRWSSPGGEPGPSKVREVVGVALREDDWASAVLADQERFGAFVVGPGLGSGPTERDQVIQLCEQISRPLVVDADALTLLGLDAPSVVPSSAILTPHDGEFERITGSLPSSDRIGSARALAVAAGCVVLLKGPTVCIAAPDGRVVLVNEGDQRLATLGTGDVLAGCIGALCAQGCDPFDAAVAGAFVHGRAARLLPPRGMVASDLIGALPSAIEAVAGDSKS